MVGVGRDLCGSPSPIPLSKQGHLQQAAQDLVQGGDNIISRLHESRKYCTSESHLSPLYLHLPLIFEVSHHFMLEQYII